MEDRLASNLPANTDDDDDRLFRSLRALLGLISTSEAGLPCQYQYPKTGAAYGIGRSGDTSPRLGCCKVAGGSYGGNLLTVQRFTTKRTAHGFLRE